MAVRPRAASVDSVINYAAARAGGGPVDGPPPGAAERARSITTPDQRLRVFISSTMVELAQERQAVRDAVARLRLIPVLWARAIARIVGGRAGDATPLLEAVIARARARDDPWLLGHGLSSLASTRPPDDPGLPSLLAEAMVALRRSGDPWSIAHAVVPLRDVALLSGDRGRPRRGRRTARAGGRSGSGPLGGPGRRPGCGHDDGGRRGPLPVDPAGAAVVPAHRSWRRHDEQAGSPGRR
jgi:hypothetical protein